MEKNTSIQSVLSYLIDEINYFHDSNPVTREVNKLARLGNISILESNTGTGNEDLQKKVILTLVNLDEEKTLKNNSHYVKQGETIMQRNPILYLNLYILLSCAHDDYEEALKRISEAISFFQSKYIFTPENAEVPFPENDVEKIVIDLFSMNFEQINNLWSILGGKYLPSVLYKLRLIPVQASEPKGARVIKAIRDNTNGK